MNKVYINAMSILADMDKMEERELLDKVLDGEQILKNNFISLSDYMRMREFRRMDRISILALLGYQPIIEEYIRRGYDLTPCGTIMNTSFGPIETNIQFASSIVENTGDGISPILFSNTVNNAALGHVCKKYKLKGPSTLVLSSDSISIAIDLLESNKTDVVFHSGLDQYSEDLSKEFDYIGIKNKELVAALSLERNINEYTYAAIIGGNDINLGGHSYFFDDIDDYTIIEEHYDKLLSLNNIKKENIAYLISNSQIDKMMNTENMYSKNASNNCKIINLGNNVGEILGASLTFSIIISALLCKYQYVEIGQVVLASSYDLSGNYITYIIERI